MFGKKERLGINRIDIRLDKLNLILSYDIEFLRLKRHPTDK